MRSKPFSPCFGLNPVTVAAVCLAMMPFRALAADAANPTSKIYVTDVNGDALIDTGKSVEDLTKRSVYTAQGTVIQTVKPTDPKDVEKHFSTMVYSNGTGAFFDADTRVEVRTFSQQPFKPDRNDNEVEPSISHTEAFVTRGAVGLCNSKLVGGSLMNYQTDLGSVNIRGQKLVIEAQNGITKISMLEGDSTVKAGVQDSGGHVLSSGKQAIIRPGAPGQPNSIEIIDIPREEMPGLDDKVTMACNAKKSVYFDVRETTTTTNADGTTTTVVNDAAGSSNEGENSGPVTAFNGNSSTSSVTVREFIPVEVVPTNLPVQYTVSPAKLVTGG